MWNSEGQWEEPRRTGPQYINYHLSWTLRTTCGQVLPEMGLEEKLEGVLSRNSDLGTSQNQV